MDNRNLILEINPKNEIIRIARGRQSVLAQLSEDNKTLTWENASLQGTYRSSVNSFLEAEGIRIETILLKGQKADVVPANAPPCPAMHKLQGEMTPDYLEWLQKWKPVAFQNLMGVECRDLEPGEKEPKDIRDLWRRETVVRSDTRATPESAGGRMITTKFSMENQIIAQRRSHLTFTPDEINRGDGEPEEIIPFKDPHHPERLIEMERKGQVKILIRKNSTASAGSGF